MINRAFINGAETQDYYISRAKAYLGLGSNEKALADYSVALKLSNNETEKKEILSEINRIKAMPTPVHNK
ncbi:MAG: hypothetical protein QNK11_03985 [Legionella sp.]|nr:hypothetical protein [Legionella sp.]